LLILFFRLKTIYVIIIDVFILYKNNKNNKVSAFMEWEQFLDPYVQAVGELKVKLRGIRKQYRKQQRHSPIEFVTGRVKSIESIQEKMVMHGISLENLARDMNDIAGLRIMVQFEDDITEVLKVLHQRKDMKIVLERDYITYKKPSG